MLRNYAATRGGGNLLCQTDFEQEGAEVKEECISILHALFPLLPPVQSAAHTGSVSKAIASALSVS